MAEPAVVLAQAANAETCTLTGLSVSVVPSDVPLTVSVVVTNVGVSQDPVDEGPAQFAFALPSQSTQASFFPDASDSTSLATATTPPVTTASTIILRFRRALPVARADVAEIQRVFDATVVNGETIVPWTVDVPEGFYVVSARVDGTPGVTIINSPRFFVSTGRDISCIADAVDPVPDPTSSPSTTLSSTTSTPTSTGDVAGKNSSASGGAKLLLPPAAIVGIAIGAAALLVLAILVCTWDRNRHRNAVERQREMVAVRHVSSSSSFFDRDLGSRAWYTNPTTQQSKPA